MKSFNEQLFTYRQQHTSKINRITHYAGVPAIIFSLMMLFNWISIDIATQWQISFTWLLLAVALLYYFFLQIRLAIIATMIMVPLAGLAMLIARPAPTHISVWVFLILFIGGWILQFVGHFFEKQKPAFFSNATQLLIGPLFVLIELLEVLGIARFIVHTEKKEAE